MVRPERCCGGAWHRACSDVPGYRPKSNQGRGGLYMDSSSQCVSSSAVTHRRGEKLAALVESFDRRPGRLGGNVEIRVARGAHLRAGKKRRGREGAGMHLTSSLGGVANR